MRVVIAEDLFLLRDGLVRLVEAFGHEVVAAVETGPAVLGALLTHRPDVAIVDVRLPPTFSDEGLQAALAARREVPGLPVLILSQHVEQLYARELLADGHGGIGYQLKDRVLDAAHFMDALGRVASGGTALDPAVVAKLLGRPARADPLAALTERERSVLALMAEGLSNTAIAAQLFLSEGAISKYTTTIFAKLSLAADDDTNRRVRAVLAYLSAGSQQDPAEPGSQARLDHGGRGSTCRRQQRRRHGGAVMAGVGYTLMTEQAGPKDLVRWAARAEEAGFDLLVSSDHYFPWLDEQGHAPNAWVTLGAVAQATERAELMTYVTCPTMRYHPAVVAQQAATLALLSDNRFTLGLGSGENLNEHVIGAGWPDADQRQDMLSEAVSIIRDLLGGGYVNFSGAYFRVDGARIWDLPTRSVPLGVAVSGRQSCELFAPLADVMIAVEPDGSLAEWWDAASDAGQPARKVGQLPICWGPDRDECIRRAHEQFRWFGGGWKVNAELPGTAGFAGATSFVRPEDVAGSIPCGDSVDAVAEAAGAFFKAGFTDLALVQIGGTEPEQERFFDAAPELITALKETAG